MIPGTQAMADNGVIEKYCYKDSGDSCTKYGGLYQWDEAMQYSTITGARGICPAGWHIPSGEDWKVLEGAVDSNYGIGAGIWDQPFWIGFDDGKNLKSVHGWQPGVSNTDLFGFTALPGGYRFWSGNFFEVPSATHWWTSNKNGTDYADYLNFTFDHADGNFDHMAREYGYSIRCVRNN